MMTGTTGIRRIFTAGLLLIGVMLVGAAYIYFELTAAPDLSRVLMPNVFDAREAERKMDLFRSALAESKQGFIRLSEVEVNSWLQEQLEESPKENVPAPREAEPPSPLKRCIMVIHDDTIIWYSFMEVSALGLDWPVVLEQKTKLVRSEEDWGFETLSLKLGRIQIPEDRWHLLERFIPDGLKQFKAQTQWIRNVPAADVAWNEWTHRPELRLYTYPEPGVLHAARE